MLSKLCNSEFYKNHSTKVACSLCVVSCAMVIIGAIALHAHYAQVSHRLKNLSLAGAVAMIALGGVMGLAAVVFLCKSQTGAKGESTFKNKEIDSHPMPPRQKRSSLVGTYPVCGGKRQYNLYALDPRKAVAICQEQLQVGQYFYYVYMYTNAWAERREEVYYIEKGATVLPKTGYVGVMSRDYILLSNEELARGESYPMTEYMLRLDLPENCVSLTDEMVGITRV